MVIVLAATIVRIVVNTVANGGSSNSTNTTNNSPGNSTGNTNGNTSAGNNTNAAGNPLNDAVVTISMPTQSSSNYAFSITLPTADAAALTSLCGSTNYTFTVSLAQSQLSSTVPFSTTGTGFAATFIIPSASVKVTPDTASYSVCGQAVPSGNNVSTQVTAGLNSGEN